MSKVEWTNPHARFYVDTTDESGKMVTWNMELASPSALARNGWTSRTLKVGDTGDGHGLRGQSGAVSRRRALRSSPPTGGRSSAARPTTAGRTARQPTGRPGSREVIVRQLFRKSQVPNPKLQIPMLVFGIGVLGLDFSLHAQERTCGRSGTVGALGQEVKRPPVRNESGAAAA